MDLQNLFLDSLRGALVDGLGLKAEAEISYAMEFCPVQDPFRFRARHLGLRVASLVIDEQGEIDGQKTEELKRFFQEGRFVLGPNREGDALIYGHMGACLGRLEEMWPWIRKFSPPVCHKKAEEIIRHTLWPEKVGRVETVHMRRAVVAAWLTFLRQATGSCFATAPAILIQQNYPKQFFKDLYDLLSLGQLKRVVAGKEYAVPLNLQAGIADLHRNLAHFPGIEFAPGVKIALEACGVAVTPAVQQKIGELGALHVEKIFQALLLDIIGLTEEEVRDEEHLAQIQMTSFAARQGGIHYQLPSERAQKVAEWKKKVATACLAFQTMTECALLRSWEYTMASFCDVKTEFARWNLYIGLGIHPDHKGGVGAFLYQAIDARLQQCNREVEELHQLYEQQISAARALEVMYNDSMSDARRHQIKAEFSMQLSEANSTLERRDQMAEKAEALSRFFSSLLEQYDAKLQEYFQELFDPALYSEEAHLYDDSPAGFRLVYKHGRRDGSQWTSIHSGEQYVDALREFFASVEPDIVAPPQIEKEWITEWTTALIRFIQEPDFLTAALKRSQEQGRKSPWHYISGGTMETLLQSYCNRSHPFTEAKAIPRSEEELLRFLTQMKNEKPLLMHSPTHAFLFYGGHLPENSLALLEKNRRFLTQTWNEEMQEHIAHRIEQRLPEQQRALFLHLLHQKPKTESKEQFRQHLLDSLKGLYVPLVDAVLFENGRLFTAQQAEEILKQLFQRLRISVQVKRGEGVYFSSLDLHQMAKTFLLETLRIPFSPIDWDMKIAEEMRHLGYSYPYPLLFADTNWAGWFLGFILNPATLRLELWRLSRIAMQGFPMSDWKEWVSPQNSAPWVVLTRPQEYHFSEEK